MPDNTRITRSYILKPDDPNIYKGALGMTAQQLQNILNEKGLNAASVSAETHTLTDTVFSAGDAEDTSVKPTPHLEHKNPGIHVIHISYQPSESWVSRHIKDNLIIHSAMKEVWGSMEYDEHQRRQR